MILHFSHIGLTDGRTFTVDSTLVVSETVLHQFLQPALATASGRRYRAEERTQHGMVAPRAQHV